MGVGELPASGRCDHPSSGAKFKDLGKKKKFHSTKSIVDFADGLSSPSRSWNPKSAPIAVCSQICSWAERCSSSASSQAQCEGSGHGRKSEKQLVVGILAHVDSGKTTLSEAMLYRAGSIRKLGRVDNKDAFLDTDTLEKARGIAHLFQAGPAENGKYEYHPAGYPRPCGLFHRDGARTLQVLDYAVLVISGTDGVRRPYRDALASAAAVSYPDLRVHQ